MAAHRQGEEGEEGGTRLPAFRVMCTLRVVSRRGKPNPPAARPAPAASGVHPVTLSRVLLASCGTTARIHFYHIMAARDARALEEDWWYRTLYYRIDVLRPSRSTAGRGTSSTHQICNLVAHRNVLHFPASPLAGEPTPLGSPPKPRRPGPSQLRLRPVINPARSPSRA